MATQPSYSRPYYFDCICCFCVHKTKFGVPIKNEFDFKTYVLSLLQRNILNINSGLGYCLLVQSEISMSFKTNVKQEVNICPP